MKKNLEDWLLWQETLHLSEIELGLDRIGKVAKKLDLLSPTFPIITVAGTNGKGSTVAFLDSILRAEGYSTGAFTSPHLVNYNERIALNGKQARDNTIIQAFEAIDKARCSIEDENGKIEEISLTYFEFSTLAAIYIYQQHEVDVAILEVGLGGRLDAANLWDASLAIITSIGVDHIDWLGDDREVIAVEKSGIMRKNVPAICGDTLPPSTIQSEAERIGSHLQQINTAFSYTPPKDPSKNTWRWENKESSFDFDLPSMSGEFQLNNAATAIAGLFALKSKLPVSINAINNGLKEAKVTGRLQILQTSPEWLIDVAHNPHAAKQLAKYIKQNPADGRTYALFSMLRDKDISEVLSIMDPVIDEWHIVATKGSRGLSLDELNDSFHQHLYALEKQDTSKTSAKLTAELGSTQHSKSNFELASQSSSQSSPQLSSQVNSEKSNKQNTEHKKQSQTLSKVISHDNFNEACDSLKKITKGKDRVVAFGSFLVISEILNNCK